ncbi:MAG: hypothetical protein CSA49_00955, partial [Gammaproteobacteria bacterium]
KVRPEGADKGRFLIGENKLPLLTQAEKQLLYTDFVDKKAYSQYSEQIQTYKIIATDIESLKGAYKTYRVEDAKALGSHTLTGASVLNGILAAIELVNFQGAYTQLASDNSTHKKMSFLGSILDMAASIEALALSVASANQTAATATNAARSSALWRSFSKAPLGVAAAITSLLWFTYETYRTGVQNKGDDAAIAYGVMAVGSGLGVYGVLSTSALAGPVGIVGASLLLVGVFLVNFVFPENSNLLEYTLGRGPFGANRDMWDRLGVEDVDISSNNGLLEISLQNSDKLWIEQKSYRLKRITHAGITLPEQGIKKGTLTNFINNTGGGYSYQTPKGSLYIGKIGEPLAGKQFNDPIEVEQYLTAGFQEKNDERFSTDIYNDKKLGYQLDASLWHGNRNSATSYFEALISAFYPLTLEMEIVSKEIKRQGRALKAYGNLLRIKYQVPFLAEVAGKPELELDIVEPTLFEDSEKEIYLEKFPILLSVKQKKPYLKASIEKGVNIVELDLDSASFLAEREIANLIHVGKSYDFVIKLVCNHKIDNKEYQQPPIIPEIDNPAKAKQNWVIKSVNKDLQGPSRI